MPISYGGTIMAIVKRRERNTGNLRQPIKVECYDITSNHWTEFTEIPINGEIDGGKIATFELDERDVDYIPV